MNCGILAQVPVISRPISGGTITVKSWGVHQKQGSSAARHREVRFESLFIAKALQTKAAHAGDLKKSLQGSQLLSPRASGRFASRSRLARAASGA
jgi:hypothetical protein